MALTNAQINQFLRQQQEARLLTIRLKKHTHSGIVALFTPDDEGKPRLQGSGNLVVLNKENYYIATAKHVLEKDGRVYDLYYPASQGKPAEGVRPVPSELPKSLATWARPYDLGLTIAPNGFVATESGKVPIQQNRFANNSQDADNDLLFVHGFPGQRSQQDESSKSTGASSFPYLTKAVKSNWDEFDSDKHIAIAFPNNNLTDENGRSVTFTNPKGLSGSFLWRLNYVPGEAWSPEQAQVVGILHTWLAMEQTLVATRIEHLSNFLLEAIRREYAYHKWIARGKPLLDDWNDWFGATETIACL